MSETDDPREPGSKLVAAEYVLGVLSAAERREADFRLARDRAFATEVAFWEERLGGLADSVEPVAPPSETWSRIERAVSAPPPQRESLWNSLAFWRPFAIGSSMLTAASIGALTYVELLPSPHAPMMARLDASTGDPSFVAAVMPGSNSLMVVPAALLTGQQQQAMELWVIPPGGAPHSLGMIEPGRPVKMTVPTALMPYINSDAVLAVSLEPPGGSPTGLPTGRVIANGKLTSL